MAAADPLLATQRLLLRHWRLEDRPAFAAINADARVMAFLPALLGRSESDALAARIADAMEERGFGFWAVEVRGGAPFIGFVGLAVPRFPAPFMPAVEIGWRLAFDAWGRGYASEAARAALVFAARRLRLAEVVSFTARGNLRSRRVMERIGMERAAGEDFEHPALPPGHPLRAHVLYRIRLDGA